MAITCTGTVNLGDVRQASKPVPHWEVLAAPEGQERTCIMLDHRGQFLNLERRPVGGPQPELPWWKKLPKRSRKALPASIP